MGFLSFVPYYHERIWGGRSFETLLKRELPKNERIGESWEIVDRAEAQSICKGDRFEGQTLRQIMGEHTSYLMGPSWEKEMPFPLLVKWLDCNERLSLQVHPPKEKSALLKSEPKTEYWYIAETTRPEAAIFVGMKKPLSQKMFLDSLQSNELEKQLNQYRTKPGNSILVPSGCIHAIDAGNLILEIQQNSDTTYRVYDWDRRDSQGRTRELHLKEALASIDFEIPPPFLISSDNKSQVIANCEHFKIQRIHLNQGGKIDFNAFEEPRIVSIVKGNLLSQKEHPLSYGDNILIPYAESEQLLALSYSILLVTTSFG
ncbi:MAG: hypothetical protein A2007_02660 [Verrucomicrobia bacterium GWC2_42_7]|nr:MAG: hypothetical protein A2007_02660 [Verrucomicrobia bacterium GWC2_42_7]